VSLAGGVNHGDGRRSGCGIVVVPALPGLIEKEQTKTKSFHRGRNPGHSLIPPMWTLERIVVRAPDAATRGVAFTMSHDNLALTIGFACDAQRPVPHARHIAACHPPEPKLQNPHAVFHRPVKQGGTGLNSEGREALECRIHLSTGHRQRRRLLYDHRGRLPALPRKQDVGRAQTRRSYSPIPTTNKTRLRPEGASTMAALGSHGVGASPRQAQRRTLT
jgi:hypothetical protein